MGKECVRHLTHDGLAAVIEGRGLRRYKAPNLLVRHPGSGKETSCSTRFVRIAVLGKTVMEVISGPRRLGTAYGSLSILAQVMRIETKRSQNGTSVLRCIFMRDVDLD